jgi:hypothetical protein
MNNNPSGALQFLQIQESNNPTQRNANACLVMHAASLSYQVAAAPTVARAPPVQLFWA